MEEQKILNICNSVDSYVGKELAESIVTGASYDALEARYGIIPISRRSFYRRRKEVKRIMQQMEMKT